MSQDSLLLRRVISETTLILLAMILASFQLKYLVVIAHHNKSNRMEVKNQFEVDLFHVLTFSTQVDLLCELKNLCILSMNPKQRNNH